MDIKNRAYIYLVLSLIFGALVPVVLDLKSGMGLSEFFVLTYLVTTIVSFGYITRIGKKDKLMKYLAAPKELALIGGIGVLNYALYEFGIAYAENFVSVPLATAIYRTFPVLMLLFIPFILREKISKYQVAALCLGFIGLFFALSGGTFQLFNNAAPSILILLVTMALGAAVGNLLVKKYSYDVDCGVFIFSIANLAVFIVIFALSGFPISAITVSSLVPILYIGVIYNIANGIMFWNALRTLKTTLVSNSIFISPFITFVFAYAILGQTPQLYYVVTALCVAIGVLIQQFDKVGGTYKASDKTASRFTIFDVTGAFANSGEVGITQSIDKGGRVLAAKLDPAHEQHLNAAISANSYPNVYTDRHVSAQESAFVKDIVGAKGNDIVVLKAGDYKEGEVFFSHLSKRISDSNVEQES